jgi:hypothetical protein
MSYNAKPVTPDDTDQVDRKISEDLGFLRYAGAIQIPLVGFLFFSLFVFLHPDPTPGWVEQFKNTLIPLTIGALVLAITLVPIDLSFRKLAARAYGAFYGSYEFVTPAGEQVSFISSNPTGTNINVRFPDGFEMKYPLQYLTNRAGCFHRWSRDPGIQSASHFHKLSKVKWLTPEGKSGLVRDIDFPRNKDIELQLKLEDGQIATFKLGQLEPLPSPMVGGSTTLALS